MLKIGNKDTVILHLQKKKKKIEENSLKGMSNSVLMGKLLSNCLILRV